MNRYIFEGETVLITQSQLDFIAQVLEKKGFKGPTVQVETVGEANDNYVANVKRIVIHEKGETFKMIAKMAPDNEAIRAFGYVQISFFNEHLMYTEVLPKFRKLQESVQIPEEDWFRFAECYGSCTRAANEIIILEDLAESKFQMFDKLKTLTNDAVKLVLKNLAIFHSLSYVLKNQEPETFKEYTSKLNNFFLSPLAEKDNIKMFFQQIESSTLAVLDVDKYIHAVTGSVSTLTNQYKYLHEADKGLQHTVIRHGDVWINNIMFKMQGEVPIRCTLIDYQVCAQNNPVCDVMCMIFCSTTYEQRKEHFHSFINYYYKEIDKYLNKFGLKANLMYPRDKLDDDIKRCAQYVFSKCVLGFTFFLMTASEASKYKECIETSDVLVAEAQDMHTMLKEMVQGLVDSFLEFGLLKFD